MITVIVKRNAEPTVIQLTQENIMRELSSIPGSEMLLEESWGNGIKRVRTPFVCLVESDCVMSTAYLSSNFEQLQNGTQTEGKKGGGYTRLAMLSSCLGIRNFKNRIYNYNFRQPKWDIYPVKAKHSTVLYPVQIGFVPGALIRMSAIKDAVLPWDDPNLLAMSAAISLHLWSTNRRVEVNPNVTYVSDQAYLAQSIGSKYNVPDDIKTIFKKVGL